MTFDPLTQVPKTDDEAKAAIFHGKPEGFACAGYGIYRIYRERDKMSVIDAYEKALLVMIGRCPA